MKKIILNMLIGLVLVAFSALNCTSPQQPDAKDENSGTLSLKFRLPKYRGKTWSKADSRVIDPMTAYAQIYLNGAQYFDLPLADGTYTASTLFTEAQWEADLPIPANSYDSLEVVLTNALHIALSSGIVYDVMINPYEKTSIAIGCVPVNHSPVTTDNTPLAGVVATGQVVYYSFDYIANSVYTATLTTQAGTPDLYVFNSLGALVRSKYNTGLTTGFDFTSPANGKFYIGIYGYNADANFNVAVNVINYGPIANTTAKLYAFTGSTLTFDASASTDTDGSITAYTWDFGDSSSANSAVAMHTYTSAGIYEAILTITDNYGSQTLASVAVTVFDDSGITYPIITEVSTDSNYYGHTAIELYNPTLTPINLNGWTLTRGDSWSLANYTFTESVILQPGEYLVCMESNMLQVYTSKPNFSYQIIPNSNIGNTYSAYICLADDTENGVDYLQYNTTDYTNLTLPPGITWSTAAGHITMDIDNISRKMPLTDTDCAADWKSTYTTLGLPTDAQGVTDISISCY